MAIAAHALGRIYAAIAAGRRRAYERHPERQKRLRRPVISIGNISVGGSGKTPAVALVARLLIDDGERPAILTRGYRRARPTDGVLVVSDGHRIRADLARAGDEAMMLAQRLPGAGVFVGADRYLAGVLAERRFGCTVHLLDDGFQHVRLARDVDIVLVTQDDLNDRVLPAGRLREAPTTLQRATLVVPELPVTDAGLPRSSFVYTRRLAPAAVPSRPVVAVAGIAHPGRFFQQLKEAGWLVACELPFRDHHPFTRADIRRIVAAARQHGAAEIVTTEKDLVRLLPFRPFEIPFTSVALDLTIEPTRAFRDWLRDRLAVVRTQSPVEPFAFEGPVAPGRG